jgi:lipoprotein-anchoring transpeptidase ErfK/SrfK
MRRLGRLAIPVVVVAMTVVATNVNSTSSGVARATARLTAGSVVASSIAIGSPTRPKRVTAMWAPLLRATSVFAEPAARAHRLARLSLHTIDGTSNPVQVLSHAVRGDAVWVRVRYPSQNGSTGWVARRSLGGYISVDTRIVVSTAHLRLTVHRAGRTIFRAPIGIGTSSNPTPHGEFYIVDRLSGFHEAFYGPVAFGTSARSPTLTDWPGGGIVGIHGTDRPNLIPGRISHGCIRLRNNDARRLARLVSVGTPITIR